MTAALVGETEGMSEITRRDVLKGSAAVIGGLAPRTAASSPTPAAQPTRVIRFAVVGLNHSHIYAQTDAIRRGGGQLVSVYAAEPELAHAFIARYPEIGRASCRERV